MKIQNIKIKHFYPRYDYNEDIDPLSLYHSDYKIIKFTASENLERFLKTLPANSYLNTNYISDEHIVLTYKSFDK